MVEVSEDDLVTLFDFLPAWKDMPATKRDAMVSLMACVEHARVMRKMSEPEKNPTPKPGQTYKVSLFYGEFKVPAINWVRHVTGVGLKEAKDLVDEGKPIELDGHNLTIGLGILKSHEYAGKMTVFWEGA
jgi:ribosomal protein L7/L12